MSCDMYEASMYMCVFYSCFDTSLDVVFLMSVCVCLIMYAYLYVCMHVYVDVNV